MIFALVFRGNTIPLLKIRTEFWFGRSQTPFVNGSGSQKMVLSERIELSTSPLPMGCCTTELRQRYLKKLNFLGACLCPEAPFLSIPRLHLDCEHARNIPRAF